ncbi:MAG: tetratricopeptide repeat protein [Thermodesulfovibrionales bacterium]
MLRALIILFLSLSSLAYANPFKGQKEAIVEVNVIDGSGRTVMAGKGYIVDSDGLIATNCRMILRWYEDIQNDLIVKLGEGNFSLHRLISYNPSLDLAIFKINKEGLPSIRLDPVDKATTYIRKAIKVYKDMSRVSNQASRKEDLITNKSESPRHQEQKNQEMSDGLNGEESRDSQVASPFLKGLRYISMRRYREAIEEFNKVLKAEPSMPDIYLNLGLAYYKINRYRDSIDAFKKALMYGATSKSVYYKLGSLYLVLGGYNEAVDAFKEALNIDNRDPLAHFNLAIAAFMKGDKDQAWQEYVVLRGIDEELARRLWDIIN